MDQEIGERIFRDAGLSPDAPPREGAIRIAAELYGGDCIIISERAQVESETAWYKGRRRIVLAPRLSTRRAHFAVARMIARLELKRLEIENASEERVAAFLVAPVPAFRRRLCNVGLDLSALADAFAVTQTCAALRIVEVGGDDGVVITPERVYRPGELLSWACDNDVRAIARSSRPQSVRKVPIPDEPGRVALYRTG